MILRGFTWAFFRRAWFGSKCEKKYTTFLERLNDRLSRCGQGWEIQSPHCSRTKRARNGAPLEPRRRGPGGYVVVQEKFSGIELRRARKRRVARRAEAAALLCSSRTILVLKVQYDSCMR